MSVPSNVAEQEMESNWGGGAAAEEGPFDPDCYPAHALQVTCKWDRVPTSTSRRMTSWGPFLAFEVLQRASCKDEGKAAFQE